MSKTSKTTLIAEMHNDIKWIKKALEGNGGPGLIEQTTANTNFRMQSKGFVAGIVAVAATATALLMWIIDKLKVKG